MILIIHFAMIKLVHINNPSFVIIKFHISYHSRLVIIKLQVIINDIVFIIISLKRMNEIL